MRRYSWASGADPKNFVICHQAYNEFRLFPYGICCPVNGATKWELIEILEEQSAAVMEHDE